MDLSPVVNEPKMKDSDATQIKKFYKEYCEVIKKNLTKANKIYIVDILE